MAKQTTPSETPDQCPTCAAERVGQFCSACGERRMHAKELGFGYFLGQVFAGVSSLDGRVLGSLRHLLTQPGGLTLAWIRGARVRFLPPFQLFVMINLVIVAIAAAFDLPSSTTRSEANSVDGLLATMSVQATELGLSMDQYQKFYDTQAARIARLSVLLAVPFAAILSQLFHVKSERRFGVHLVFATHLVTYFLLVTDLFVGSVICPLLRPETGSSGWLYTLWLSMLPASLAIWWFFAERRVFGVGRFAALWRAGIGSMLILVVGLMLHQSLLFKLTIYSLGRQ